MLADQVHVFEWQTNDLTRKEIKESLETTTIPCVIKGAIDDWKAMLWNPMVLSKLCGDLQTSVRVGKLRKV